MQKRPDPGFFAELEAREIVKQVTDPELAQALGKEPMTLYIGFDPTADSLHVGGLLPLVTLRRFQLAGHRPIAVIGGATGMIGDPSGKTQERSLLTDEKIAHNLKGITKNIAKVLDLSPASGAKVLNNADWTRSVSYIEFLRDIGKHFTVNHMTAKESVRARLEDREHGISYTEFSYMLLQAYDFLVLKERENCLLQVGGSDQWGNITAGIDLIRKVHGTNAGVYGMTHPLVMKADGTKFGKSEQGAIWLDSDKTSPYQFYQYFIQTTDADVIRLLRYYTFLPLKEIASLENSLKTEPEKRTSQLTLARELTRMVHGDSELSQVERTSQALFGSAIKELDERSLLDVMSGAPTTQKSKDLLSQGIPLVELVAETGLCSSKGAARKDITAGGIYVNNDRVNDASHVLKTADLISGGYIVLRKGKRTYHLVAFR